MTAAGVTERRPQRSRLEHQDHPPGSFRRGELAAGLVTLAVASQLVFAPVTLLIAALLALSGRIGRWRPAWLLLPALAGACWLAAAGMPAAAAALETGSARLAGAELAAALHPGVLLHLRTVFAGASRWVPRELPLALLAGTTEAAVVLWSGWWRRGRRPGTGPDWRPGLVSVLRRRAAIAALAAGHTVTADGCAIGVANQTGRLAGFSWAEAEHGVLLAGGDERELGKLGLAVACAAIRRRKTVLVVDLGSAGTGEVAGYPAWLTPGSAAQADGPAAAVTLLASRLGMQVTSIGGSDGSLAAVIGRAVRSRGVVVISARQPEAARQALTGLTGLLSGLRDLGLRADCLTWVIGSEPATAPSPAMLIDLGVATGTSILLSTTSTAQAAQLAACAGVTVACGYISGELASRLTGAVAENSQAVGNRSIHDVLRAQLPGEFTISGSRPSVSAGCRMVTTDLTEVR